MTDAETVLAEFDGHPCEDETCGRCAAVRLAKGVWQPIETAPKGEQILVFIPDAKSLTWGHAMPAPVAVVIKDDDGEFHIEHDGDGGCLHWRNQFPTHWMPLPTAPDTEESNG